MGKLLVHIVSGPEHATRAALGFLVAQGALDEGHDVTVFLAADGVNWVNRPTTDAISALGGGPLTEALDKLKSGGATFYASKLSLGARGIDEARAGELGAQMGTPAALANLSVESDATLSY